MTINTKNVYFAKHPNYEGWFIVYGGISLDETRTQFNFDLNINGDRNIMILGEIFDESVNHMKIKMRDKKGIFEVHAPTLEVYKEIQKVHPTMKDMTFNEYIEKFTKILNKG